MHISVEMTQVSKKTQFHVALSIALFFLFSVKPMVWVPCGISVHVQQLNNRKKPDLESPCPKLSNGICLQNSPRGVGAGGGFHALAHGLIVL